jgi:pilus assembly protein FimV
MAVRREQVIRTAEKYVSKGRIDAAIKEYRKVLDKHPNDVNTLNRLGDLYARVQRYDEAVGLFERIAGNYTDDGFFVKAIAIYKKIIKLDPTRLEIYERLADLYHKQGLINEARTQYQVLADYYTKHDNPTSAIKVYGEMAELEPDNPSHHVKLAELYAGLKLVDKAMAEYATIAELMIEHGHPEEATQVYRKALDVDDSDIEFVTDAARKLKAAGHISEAARFLAIATERNPEARHVARKVGMEPEPKPEPEPTEEAAPEAPTAEAKAAPAAVAPAKVEPARTEAASVEPLEAESADEALVQEAAPLPEPTAEPAEEESEVDLVLDLEDTDTGVEEVLAAAEPGAAAPTAVEPETPAAGAGEEIDLDLDRAFVLDLEDDAPSASQVQPPPDMLHGRPARAFRIEDEGEAPTGPAAAVQELPTRQPEPPVEPVSEEPVWQEPVLEEPALEEPVSKEAMPEEPVSYPLVEADERVELDREVLEQTVSDLQPEVVQRDENELVSEAEVLAKYNMTEKAVERLREALSLDPHHLEAHEVLLKIHLDEGDDDEIPRLAARMARAAETVGDSDRWPRMRQRLEKAGFRFEEDEPAAPPVPPPRKKKATAEDRVNRLLSDLLGDVMPRRKRREKPARPPMSEPLEPVSAAPVEEGPPVIEEPPLPDPDDITLHGIFDEVEVEEPSLPTPEATPVEPPSFEEVTEPPSPEPQPTEPPSLDLASAEVDDSGTSWLDEVEAEPAATSADAEEFRHEDDFFDLAGELEQELSREEALDPDGLVQPREQTLEEIVEGFKQGVAENLSPEDYDTHFNLGIAYREMGLLDEAIGEFQLSSKSRPHLVECCSMLGLCFLDKGLPELAIKWYRQGLETSDLTDEETLGLLYDMGNLYLDMDDREAAHKTFVEIYGINSNYRDVVAKLEELKRV